MGLFKTYKTDKDIEKTGVAYTPDSGTLIMLARAGGANVKYNKVLEAKAKPHRRQIDAGTLDPMLDRKMMAEVLAATVIKSWESLLEDENGKPVMKPLIEADPDAPMDTYDSPIDENGMVPASTANIVATLMLLPDLMQDIQAQASRSSNYSADREDDAKN